MKQSELEPNRPGYHTYQGRGTDIDTRRMRRARGVSQTDVTSSRAFNGTVYQNTSGKVMIATVQAYSAGSGNVTLYCASGSSPSVIVGGMATPIVNSCTFVIPPNYYYKATIGLGSPTVNSWVEWTLS